jgi:EpsI family protein
MNKRARRYLPAVLFFGGFLAVWSTRSQTAVPLAGPLSTVLPDLSGYRVTNQVVDDEERKVAGMSDYVARVFWRPDSTPAFTTYVGYYDRQTQGKSMHSPRNCMPGAGWEILRADTGTVRSGGVAHVVNKYLLKNGSTQAIVYYWYQGRGRVVANEYAVKWNLMRDAALKGHTEEALVRIVVFVDKAGTLQDAALDKAMAEAARLGESVGGQLLSDVARVLPNQPAGASRTAAVQAADLRLASASR